MLQQFLTWNEKRMLIGLNTVQQWRKTEGTYNKDLVLMQMCQ